MRQRTDEWFKSRNGKFSASDIYRLLGKEGLKKTIQSIDNYAHEKAVEHVFGRDEEEIFSRDIQRGVELEPLAFNCFKEIKLYDFIETTECGFIEHNEHSGSSPDGLVSDNSVLEIKCPRRNKFFKLVANGYDEIDDKYIAQMQMQMLCTKSEKAYFFNYYIEKGLQHWHEITVQRDETMIDLIKDRIHIAAAIKMEYINKLKSNQQW